MPHMQQLAAGRRVPMETEEHALLWCGLYEAARCQLFQEIRQLTGRTDVAGRYLLKQGPVDLERLVASNWSDGRGVDAALSIVLGGLGCAAPGPVSLTGQERQVNSLLQQACKSFVGTMVRQRREWHRTQSASRDRLHPRATLDSWLQRAATAPAGLVCAGSQARPQRRRAAPGVRRGAPHRGRRTTAQQCSGPARRGGGLRQQRAPRGRSRSDPRLVVQQQRPLQCTQTDSRQLPIVRYLSLASGQ
jgi:hypothetical protein